MSAELPTFVDILGALVGGIGVSLAIYFQLIARRSCPSRYVLAFFVFGSTILLLSGEAFYLRDAVASALAVLGALLALVAEVAFAGYVWRRIRTEPLTEPAAWLDADSDGELGD